MTHDSAVGFLDVSITLIGPAVHLYMTFGVQLFAIVNAGVGWSGRFSAPCPAHLDPRHTPQSCLMHLWHASDNQDKKKDCTYKHTFSYTQTNTAD